MAGTPVSEDEALLQCYLDGSLDAFETLVARHGSALLAYIRGMAGSREEAEDLFQETWSRVIRHGASFKAGTVRGWIWRIARNAVIDYLRRRKPEESLDRPVGEDGAVVGDFLAAGDISVPDRVDAADLGHRIAACVTGLPAAQREVFLMRTAGDLSFNEIAATLGVPLNTALGRMHYAVARLREALADERRET